MKPAISISHLYKTFKDERGRKTEALKDITLEVKAGEFFVILGPSGSGKSTLLRLITGIDMPTEGKVSYDPSITAGVIDRVTEEGKAHASAVSPHTINANFVFQQFALLPWLTVAENIELGLIGRKVPEAERAEIVHRELAEFHLEHYAHSYPRELSGGMRQRVGLARAFATAAPLIFLDEPFSELDLYTAEELRQELLRIWRERKCTVVMVSHNITEAIELADRIAVFSGRPGTIRKIVENPLPRPRNTRSPESFAMEDELYELLRLEAIKP